MIHDKFVERLEKLSIEQKLYSLVGAISFNNKDIANIILQDILNYVTKLEDDCAYYKTAYEEFNIPSLYDI